MIYLNSAATSYPKPAEVLNALQTAAAALPAGQFRSSASSESSDLFDQCRARLAEIIGTGHQERIFFSSGATDSLNAIFRGLAVKAHNVVTTVAEHNSVLRPLYNQKDPRGDCVTVGCDRNGFVSMPELENTLKDLNNGSRSQNQSGCCQKSVCLNPKALILNHCSNVTGAVQNAAEAGKLARKYGYLFILDASQSAGCLPVEAEVWGVDALAFTGHKALRGMQGTGGYYVREGLSFRPFRYGGTGKNSQKLRYGDGEYEYEPGTQNSPGIAALNAACECVLRKGVKQIAAREQELRGFLVDKLETVEGIHIFGDKTCSGPVISFTMDGITPADLSYILQNAYGIITRSGYMCAPLIHSFLGTERDGVVRVSFSDMTNEQELQSLIDALHEIGESVSAGGNL